MALSFGRKREINIAKQAIANRHIIKSWYLQTGIKYMNSRKFQEKEEKLLEEVTDFFLNNLEHLEDILDEKFDY